MILTEEVEGENSYGILTYGAGSKWYDNNKFGS